MRSISVAADVSFASAADCPENNAVNSLSPAAPKGAVTLNWTGNGKGSSSEPTNSSISLFLMKRAGLPLIVSVTNVHASSASASAAR